MSFAVFPRLHWGEAGTTNATLQVFNSQFGRGVLPRRFKFALSFLRRLRPTLLFQAFGQAEQRASITGIVFQILAENLLSFSGIASQQQRRAQ